MTFRFRGRGSIPKPDGGRDGHENEHHMTGSPVLPKLTSAQLAKLMKLYPTWLRDDSGLKQLPGIYHGVLGQVQLRPGIGTKGCQLGIKSQHQVDYMNRFTDTERVHQLLSASRLSNETLAAIWAHVNKTFPGRLTNREVCLALALIALFQRIESAKGSTGDPFILVKSEKKPPVPTLHPSHGYNGRQTSSKAQVTSSKSIPSELSSGELLVDIGDENKDDINRAGSYPFLSDSASLKLDGANIKQATDNASSRQLIRPIYNLMDTDGDRFEVEFSKLSRVWSRVLGAMRAIFNRSFDVLMVENSRKSAIEALKSPRGRQFSRLLSVCYPLAHNIKSKIDELNVIQFDSSTGGDSITLFDKNYIIQINDLTTSINEYWAVLINLFHESGQTSFTELIMDGLNYQKCTVVSRSIDELANELNGGRKPDTCSICHTKFYLIDCDDPSRELEQEEMDLVRTGELLSEDGQHYYHARCANFWLHNVDPSGLPFRGQLDDEILSPATNVKFEQ